MTLSATVLASHFVELTGTVMDTQPAGVSVHFDGAVTGDAITDTTGYFSYLTDTASLGVVNAVATDGNQQTSDPVWDTIAVAAPTLSLITLDVGSNTVTVAGTSSGIDAAGSTVFFSGVGQTCAVTDANGDFILTVPVTGVGTLQADTTDLWGQTSNSAQVRINALAPAPQITLNSQVLPGHHVQLTGNVTDADPAGVKVTFSGAVAGSVITDSQGHFTYMTSSAVFGTVYATGVDQQNQSTNSAEATVAVDAPGISLSVLSTTLNTVTLSGTVLGLDAAGATVNLGGAASGSVVADANGIFLITTMLTSNTPTGSSGASSSNGSLSGTSHTIITTAPVGGYLVQATTTDLWAQTSNTAQVAFLTDGSGSSGPQVTLTSQVLAGHEVQLSGQVLDPNPAGLTVTFGGAITGSTTTDTQGNFVFTTTSGSLGTVTAVAVGSTQNTSNIASASVATPPPVVTVSTSSSASGTTISGTVTGLDAVGETVSMSGAKGGTAVCDANGNFSFTLDSSLSGIEEVSTDDLWGQAAVNAAVTLDETQPVIENFTVVHQGGNRWWLCGQALGSQLAGLPVNLGGIPELNGLTTSVHNDSWFYQRIELPEDTIGTATAQLTDSLGATSNLATAEIRT